MAVSVKRAVRTAVLPIGVLGFVVGALLALSCGGSDDPPTKADPVAMAGIRVEMHYNPG